MLVVQWNALNEAIPRLQADERYNDYLVSVASSPYAGKAGQQLAESWREQAWRGFQTLAAAAKRGGELSLATAFSIVRGAFGDAIRD